jgi:hypothetical protein
MISVVISWAFEPEVWKTLLQRLFTHGDIFGSVIESTKFYLCNIFNSQEIAVS